MANASHSRNSLLLFALVHVITRKRLNEFAEKYPDTKSALVRWYALMRKSRFSNFVQLRETFPQADQVGKFTVFDIGGNKVRLIAAVHYNRNKIYPAGAGPRVDTSGVRRGQVERVICQSLNSRRSRRPGRHYRAPSGYLTLKRITGGLVELLDRITDEVGEDENHPLASLMDVLGVLIEKYEDEHLPELTE
jgi:mRNA interferase HigB